MLLLEQKTEIIIGCFYTVYNELGYGFLEKVYENALLIELSSKGFSCIKQGQTKVFYKENIVGTYFSDIIVDQEIILEIKAGTGSILMAHEKQLANYLKATHMEVGFVFHFGEKPSFKRQIFKNIYK